jgi:hypothetical protein
MTHSEKVETLELAREDIRVGLEAAQKAFAARDAFDYARHTNLAVHASCSAERYCRELPLTEGETEEIQAGMTTATRTAPPRPIRNKWWAVQGSNLRQPACKAGALPLS